MEERKERVNEKTVEERIEAVENKLDIILESQATIMNAWKKFMARVIENSPKVQTK